MYKYEKKWYDLKFLNKINQPTIWSKNFKKKSRTLSTSGTSDLWADHYLICIPATEVFL